jgi:4-hydroxy-2-oxoheptanedioate aldolase
MLMRPNIVRQRFAADQTVINAWLSIGSSYSAEGMGHAGFHAVTVDLQHGMLGFTDALTMLQAISATPATPLVRVPDLDPAKIMHLLDAGAYGVICPMISSAEQARKLVSACRYPPLGERSFGPSRGLLYGGSDYVSEANSTVMAIPMIETVQAVNEIDQILDVDGIDMIYLGPNDMAFALDGHVSFPRPDSEKALASVLHSATAKGIPVGIFCTDAADASARVAQGYRMVTPANDFAHLTRSASAAVQSILEAQERSESATTNHGY